MMKKIIAICTVLLLLTSSGAVYALDRTDAYFKLKKYDMGTQHGDVAHIQFALVRGGYLKTESFDGVFDQETADAVRSFQKANGLAADGIAGPVTLEKMFEKGLLAEISVKVLKPGLESQDVDILQLALMDLGYLEIDTATSRYGKLTENAVRRFQRSRGLVADGIAGAETLRALQSLGYLFLAETGTEGETELGDSVGALSKLMLVPGERNQDVVLIKLALQRESLYIEDEVTDLFDEEMWQSVLEFQRRHGLTEDGIVGSQTIAKLAQLGYVEPVRTVSRQAAERRFGEALPWSQVMEFIDKGVTVFLIEDFYTGQTFQMLAAYGGVHSDVEPLTSGDAHVIKTIWGGEYSWVRRPVLVHFNGRVIAASLNGMPHAGMDIRPEGQYIDVRSGGYGYGYNFDSVKGNDFDGHLCLHFKESKLHSDRKEDPKHQENILIAAGLK